MTGTIKSQLQEKGYGFIKSDEDGREYFFHSSCCLGNFTELSPGRKVQFEVATSPKGPRAEDVSLL